LAFTLIPVESRRLIEKAVVLTEAIRFATQKAYILLTRGTAIGFIAQELLSIKVLELQKSTSGTYTHRLLCGIDVNKPTPFPMIP
jgi:hypothetical protein